MFESKYPGRLVGFLCLFMYIGAGRVEKPPKNSQLIPIESIWVPDSVFSPYGGIDYGWKVWWWKWENGMAKKKPPFKTWSEALDAGDYESKFEEKDIESPDPLRIPNEPDYLSREHFTRIRAGESIPPHDLNSIMILEAKLNHDDPDTIGAFLRYSKKKRKYYSYNSRYRLVVRGDTVTTFIAGSTIQPVYPIVDTRSWEDGYSFIYQRYDGEGNIGRSKYSIHAVVNGEDLNDRGYANTLAPAFLDGRLFFLFEIDGKWGWSYDGVEHPNQWDRVYHHYGDGESGPHSRPSWKGFCALRDGMWYKVRFERVRK